MLLHTIEFPHPVQKSGHFCVENNLKATADGQLKILHPTLPLNLEIHRSIKYAKTTDFIVNSCENLQSAEPNSPFLAVYILISHFFFKMAKMAYMESQRSRQRTRNHPHDHSYSYSCSRSYSPSYYCSYSLDRRSKSHCRRPRSHSRSRSRNRCDACHEDHRPEDCPYLQNCENSVTGSVIISITVDYGIIQSSVKDL